MRENNRRRHDRADHQHHRHHGDERHDEGDEIETDETALLLFLVGDVQRVDDRLHAGVGAPKREQETEGKAEAEPTVVDCRQAFDLLVQDVDRAPRQDSRERRNLLVDVRRVGEKAVHRHQRRQRGEEGEDSVEDDPSRDREQTVVVDLRVEPPEDVFPAPPWDVPRRGGLSSASPLLKAPQILGPREAFLLLPWGALATGRQPRPLSFRRLTRRKRFTAAGASRQSDEAQRTVGQKRP